MHGLGSEHRLKHTGRPVFTGFPDRFPELFHQGMKIVDLHGGDFRLTFC